MKTLTGSLIFCAAILTISCAPAVIMPDIPYRSYESLKAEEPDCTVHLDILQIAGENLSLQQCLDTVFCYRNTWKYWENNYRVIEAQLEAAADK